MSGYAVVYGRPDHEATERIPNWIKDYLHKAAVVDLGCAACGMLTVTQLRFSNEVTWTYLALSLALPLLWVVVLWLAGAYDIRFIGTGSDEFRKVLNARVGLTAATTIFSYAVNLQLFRSYVVIALPSVTVFDLFARYAMHKHLHRQRAADKCLHNVIAVGYEPAVADLVKELRRDKYYGLTVVGVCVAGPGERDEVTGVPVYGGLDDITAAVKAFDADTVAVTARPEMDGRRLRSLAWEHEKTGTDLCVSPALLDVAGTRTTIRPTAGLTLLHVDHPQLGGFHQVLKDLFDRCAAALVLIMLAQVMAVVAATIRLHDRGLALFTQLFPGEAKKQRRVRRRLVVKPGTTGLWQVNRRSDLSWEESVRLDLRYVESWSFALDLQILWKTISVILRRSGAY